MQQARSSAIQAFSYTVQCAGNEVSGSCHTGFYLASVIEVLLTQPALRLLVTHSSDVGGSQVAGIRESCL